MQKTSVRFLDWEDPLEKVQATHSNILGLPCESAGKESTCNVGNPWVGKIPWRMERLPTPVFWTGEFLGLYSPWGHKELDMTERLSISLHTVKGFSVVNEAEVDVFQTDLAFSMVQQTLAI